jgi:hypothetical protein
MKSAHCTDVHSSEQREHRALFLFSNRRGCSGSSKLFTIKHSSVKNYLYDLVIRLDGFGRIFPQQQQVCALADLHRPDLSR